MSVFGFSTEASAGNADIIPIVKFDARAGRIFRIDRTQDASGTYSNEPADITRSFKAIVDLENIEVGWINFNTGSIPHFALVPMGTPLPPRPTPDHKNGIRVMLKLAKDCGGDVRELANTAKAFLSGMEALYTDYLAGKDANKGKLPVITLDDTLPIKTGTGDKASTNYRPVFKIASWAPRGDLVFKPKGGAPAAAPATPPATGSTVVPPPKAKAAEPEMAEADEFG